jgi:hypothetical protein
VEFGTVTPPVMGIPLGSDTSRAVV